MVRLGLDPVHNRKPSDYYYIPERRPLSPRRGPARRKLLLPTIVLVILFTTFVAFNSHEATSSATRYLTNSISNKARTKTTSTTTTTSKHAGTIQHVLSPADGGNADVCKLVLSAAINDYPLVTLYNYHKTGDKLAKISGGLDYMKRIPHAQDNELVLIVDGFDEWFQLPPSILTARYHAINARENARVLTRTGKPYTQSIVISTQRQCWPGNGSSIACYAAPESPLPAFIFGPQTDNMVDGWNKHAKLRPRYLNAGYIMGPVGEMRRLWTRAQEYADEDPNVVGGDQNILARIWGEQNYMREFSRFNNEPLEEPELSNPRSQKRALKFGYPEDDSAPPRQVFTPKNDTYYEFGIGLDYGSELSIPTVFAEFDADWLAFSNKTSLDVAFEAGNVTTPGATHLQADIAALPAPFAMLQGSDAKLKDEQVERTSWSDVGLFTNMWTGITPAVVHHNAWREGLKDRRTTTWQRMWFQPYARRLLDVWAAPHYRSVEWTSTQSVFRGASARVRRFVGTEDAEKVEKREKVGMREVGAHTDNDKEGNWVRWGDLCNKDMQEEVFRDGRGIWVGPGGASEVNNEEHHKGLKKPVKRWVSLK